MGQLQNAVRDRVNKERRRAEVPAWFGFVSFLALGVVIAVALFTGGPEQDDVFVLEQERHAARLQLEQLAALKAELEPAPAPVEPTPAAQASAAEPAQPAASAPPTATADEGQLPGFPLTGARLAVRATDDPLRAASFDTALVDMAEAIAVASLESSDIAARVIDTTFDDAAGAPFTSGVFTVTIDIDADGDAPLQTVRGVRVVVDNGVARSAGIVG